MRFKAGIVGCVPLPLDHHRYVILGLLSALTISLSLNIIQNEHAHVLTLRMAFGSLPGSRQESRKPRQCNAVAFAAVAPRAAMTIFEASLRSASVDA